MTEQDLQQALIDGARWLGYRVAHFRPAWTARGYRTPVEADGAGFPDLVICGHGHLLFAECKSRRGRLQPEQQAWLEALAACGVHAVVVRPAPAPGALGLDEVLTMLERLREEGEHDNA
jgi:hypothetical protein